MSFKKRAKPGEYRDPSFPSMFAMLYQMLRRVAMEHGYALALHGSMARDLDVIAVPWELEASTPGELVKAIQEATQAFIVVNHSGKWHPEEKPHGRLGWSLHLVGSGTYIDLSVMPCLPAKGVAVS